ncbi:hypothetical protein BC831DRAFT_548431 [Entophlyctis helioformis]|nr:hypothetical protein BC831DRAFT_548431 [Entophlyctis helioformis]
MARGAALLGDGQVLTLWVHDERYSRHDVVINPHWFPGIQLGDLLEIRSAAAVAAAAGATHGGGGRAAVSAGAAGRRTHQQQQQQPNHSPLASHRAAASREGGRIPLVDFQEDVNKDRLVLQVSVMDDELAAKQPQLHISVAQHIATLFELNARTDVLVRKVDKESMTASFVEISFRDQYIGRSDMWRLKMSLIGTALYRGKKLVSLGVRGQVKDIIVNGTSYKCGFVTDTTKSIFRSETAKYFIFIQMSKEMWEFDEDGELFFEKCVHGFLPELFARWKEIGANHVVSIVLFARIMGAGINVSHHGHGHSSSSSSSNNGSNININITPDDPLPQFNLDAGDFETPLGFASAGEYRSATGQPCRDYYRVVVDRETRADWAQVLVPLKKEFVRFQRDVLEQREAKGLSFLSGSNSPASEGNILEAINLALNPFDKHYVDRDLMRTGLTIVVVTPGTGFYEVDKKLCRLTWQRMVDNGVGLDLVCLSKPPLYTVPLFQFVSHDGSALGSGMQGGAGFHQGGTYTAHSTGAASYGAGAPHMSPSSVGTDPSVQSQQQQPHASRVPSMRGASGGASGGVGQHHDPDSDRRSTFTATSRSERHQGDMAFSGKSGGSEKEKKTEVWDPLYADDDLADGPLASFYTIPNWVDCSFWSRKDPARTPLGLAPGTTFVSRCKMYEVQMMGFQEQDRINIDIPYLDLKADDALVSATSPLSKDAALPEQNASSDGPNDANGANAAALGLLWSKVFDEYDAQVFVDEPGPALSAQQSQQQQSYLTVPHSSAAQLVRNTDHGDGQREFGADSHHMDSRPQRGMRGAGSPNGLGVQGMRQPYPATLGGIHGGISGNAAFDSLPQPLNSTGMDDNQRTLLPYPNYQMQQQPFQKQPQPHQQTAMGRREQPERGLGLVGSFKDRTDGTSFDAFMAEQAAATGTGTGRRGGGSVSGDDHAHSHLYPQRASGRAVADGSTAALDADTAMHSFSTSLQPIRIRGPGSRTAGAIGGTTSTGTSVAPITVASSLGERGLTHASGHRGSFSETGSYKGASSPGMDFGRHLNAGKMSPGKSFSHLANRQQIPRQNYVNPCNPIKNVIRASSHIRRWEHIFPKVVMANRDVDVASTNWKSLCTPACLPLTTEFFPSPEELADQYLENTNLLSPAVEDAAPYQWTAEMQARKLESLLVELISQRLAQGFQLVVSTARDGTQKLPGMPAPASLTAMSALETPRTPDRRQRMSIPQGRLGRDAMGLQHAQVYQPTSTFSTAKHYDLSLGDHVHRLSYDTNSSNNIEIKCYLRKISYDTSSVPYKCAIWPKNMAGYELRSFSFAYPSLENYKWSYLDGLVAGYQDKMTEALRYWRTRFLLIPAESVSQQSSMIHAAGTGSHDTLDEEEIRLAGFNRFIDMIEKSRWVPPGEAADADARRKRPAKRAMEIQFTTFDTTSFVKNEVLRATDALPSISSAVSPAIVPDRLTKSSSLLEIAMAMQQASGPPFKNRRWHIRVYERACIGSEAVDWLVRAFTDIDTRDEAIEHRFMDGFYFYRIGRDYDVELVKERPATQSTWFGSGSRPSAVSAGSTGSASQAAASGASGVPMTAAVTAAMASGGKQGHLGLSAPGDKDRDSDKDRDMDSFTVSATAADAATGDASAAAAIQTAGSGTLTHSTSMMLSRSSSGQPLDAREPFPLSRQMAVGMDPQRKSTRQEVAVIHYDTTHNPKNCYHIQLHWLVCTPRLIEDMLYSWVRMAEKCSLRLVEAPVEQARPFSDDNPFQSVVTLVPVVRPPALAVFRERLAQMQHAGSTAPPATATTPTATTPAATATSEVPPLWFEAELLRSHGYVLDVEADRLFPPGAVEHSFLRSPYEHTQYVHRSGVAFVQICDDGRFLWADNRVFLASSSGFMGPRASPAAMTPDALRGELQRLCDDGEFLERFWADAERRLVSSLTLVSAGQPSLLSLDAHLPQH